MIFFVQIPCGRGSILLWRRSSYVTAVYCCFKIMKIHTQCMLKQNDDEKESVLGRMSRLN